jgi:hypothetical protein
MIDPLPRWAKLFIAFLVLVVAVLVVRNRFDDGLGEPVEADWRVEPGTVLGPDSTRIPVEVHEVQCASGRSAEGRVVADVSYGTEAVVIDISVRPFGGDQECPGNPLTPFVVELDEPLGDRPVTGERWPAP